MAKLTIPIRVDALEEAKECSKEFYEKGYQQGREDAIDEITDNFIEKIEEILKWYKDKHKQFSDVQICIVLEDFESLIEELKENNDKTE